MKHHKTDDQLIEIKEFAMPTICFTGCSSYILVQLFVPCFLSVVLWRGNYTKATNGGNWQDICFSSQP